MNWQQKLKDRILMAYHITRYQVLLFLQQCVATVIAIVTRHKVREWPPLTVFISSYNTIWPLRLTLKSLQNGHHYPHLRFLFGENESADGSAKFLQKLAGQNSSVQIVYRPLQPHGLWIDLALVQAQTPYLLVADSDLLFFDSGLLQDIIDYMEREKDCWLLESDERPRTPYPEDPEIDCPEAISTWFFCIRTELRQQISQSFLGRFGEEKMANGKSRVHYECGAAVLEEMRAKKLRYDVMPWWMRQKFYHFGNLSWFEKVADRQNRFVKMKAYQMRDIERRVRRLDHRPT